MKSTDARYLMIVISRLIWIELSFIHIQGIMKTYVSFHENLTMSGLTKFAMCKKDNEGRFLGESFVHYDWNLKERHTSFMYLSNKIQVLSKNSLRI